MYMFHLQKLLLLNRYFPLTIHKFCIYYMDLKLKCLLHKAPDRNLRKD